MADKVTFEMEGEKYTSEDANIGRLHSLLLFFFCDDINVEQLRNAFMDEDWEVTVKVRNV